MSREAQTINGKVMLTAKDVAEAIGMSVSWVEKAGKAGLDLPRPVRVGSAKRWRAVDIVAWSQGKGAGAAR